MEIQHTQPEQEQSYFVRRMQLLGIGAEQNTIKLRLPVFNKEKQVNELQLQDCPIFKPGPKGIDIYVWGLDHRLVYKTKEQSFSGHVQVVRTADPYIVTRLEFPEVKKDGSEKKYNMPKGQSTQPWFPPQIMEQYDRCREWKEANPGKALPPNLRIKALYMTEGYFKAFKAGMHGILCIGIASITCMANKHTGTLHEDIEKLLVTCEVERFIWLTDGDCRNITTKEITDDKDLYQRPYGFFNSVVKFIDYTSKYPDVRRYFAHIQTDDLEKHPKGLDDLLCEYPEELESIENEFNDFSGKTSKGIFEGEYLRRQEVLSGTNPIRRYFMLTDVDEFYHHHVQKRPELENTAFVYAGTTYKYNEKESKCTVQIPGAAERYFRVGDSFYEWMESPNKHAQNVRTYKPRKKETITDDHGKGIIKHVVKYLDWCIVPSHTNYQPIINNHFNRYLPLQHEPEPGECPVSLSFIKHIFGTEKVTVTNADGSKKEIESYELGLDYITILYRYPAYPLPILCLVSKQNSTGKSTFLDWMNAIFGGNMIQVGNEELANQFNDFWTPKLIVACDETKVDKQTVFEKIKRMSTGDTNISQGKGTRHEVVDNFLHFMFCSNNEDNFINISTNDNRFWVRKVPQFTKEHVGMRDDLRDEIEAFLYYLLNRQMAVPCTTRTWFDYNLLKTEALQKLIESSIPKWERLIRQEITELFDMCDAEEFTITLKGFCEDILPKNADKIYIKRILNDMGYTVGDTMRGVYPVRTFSTALGESTPQESITYKGFVGRAYTFLRKDFTTAAPPAATNAKDDLPF